MQNLRKERQKRQHAQPNIVDCFQINFRIMGGPYIYIYIYMELFPFTLWPVLTSFPKSRQLRPKKKAIEFHTGLLAIPVQDIKFNTGLPSETNSKDRPHSLQMKNKNIDRSSRSKGGCPLKICVCVPPEKSKAKKQTRNIWIRDLQPSGGKQLTMCQHCTFRVAWGKIIGTEKASNKPFKTGSAAPSDVFLSARGRF